MSSGFVKKRMTKTKDKVTLQVLISRKTYEMLVKLAPEIYGATRGALSYVVEEALRLYLEPRMHAQRHTNPKHGIRIVYGQVVEQVKKILNVKFKPAEIQEKILDLAIAETRGSDPRTIAKWKKLFEKSGLIKYAGGIYPNRIYELL